ncbi:MAG TPA: flippase [Candidatus Kryptonia bacterium]
MIRKALQFIRRGDNRQVASNVFSLSVLQAANSILPLITVPYIVRVIGPNDYGIISFAQAFTTYFVLLIMYGFDFTASREIAQNRSDPGKISEIFWTVIWSRAFLFFISTAAFLAALFWVPQIRENMSVMVVSYLYVIGTVTFPTWFFQGIEKLGLRAVFTFIVKVITTAGVFVFLHREDQYIVVPLLLSVGQVVVGVLSLVYASQKYVGKVVFPRMAEVWSQLKSGFTLFVSTVFVNFYTVSNTVILAFFATKERVGFFAAGSKLTIVLQSLTISALSQAMFPHIAKMMKESKDRGIMALKKLTVGMVVTMLPISLVTLLFSQLIVRIVFGSQFGPTVVVLRLLSFFPLITGLSAVFGIQGLLNLNLDKSFLRIILIGSVVNFVLNCVLDSSMKELGAATSWLITETYITAAFYIALRKVNVNLFDASLYRQWLFKEVEGREV